MHRCLSSAKVAAVAVCVLLATLAPASGQTPTTAEKKTWDIWAGTGGSAGGSRNVYAVTLDASGAAGPIGSVWISTYAPLARLGRLDPSLTVNNYREWRSVYQAGNGRPERIAINNANGDVWNGLSGDLFSVKLGGTDTFRHFLDDTAIRWGISDVAVAADNAAVVAVPSGQLVGTGGAILRIPRNGVTGSPYTMWSVGGQPWGLAIDGTGKIWFSEFNANKVGRLDPANAQVTEWALPAGTGPKGLTLTASGLVCVVSEGIPAAPYNGLVHCLNPATNTFAQYPSGSALEFPRDMAPNADGEFFVTEPRTDTVAFVSHDAIAVASTVVITPTSRTVAPQTRSLYVEDEAVTPVVFTIQPEETTLTATDNGAGVARFRFPLVPDPSIELRPQPIKLSAVFDDHGRGTGSVYVAESFNGHGTQGRVSALRIIPPPPPEPVIETNPDALVFDAIVDAPPPAAQTLSITNAGTGALQWSAAMSAGWLTLSETSGTAPSVFDVSVNHQSPALLAPGSYNDTITITATGATPRTVPVTLNVTTPPVIEVSQTSFTFVTTAGLTPAPQSLTITNGGGGTLAWTAQTSTPFSVTPQGTAPGAAQVFASSSNLPPGEYTATLTITAANATNSPLTIALTLTVEPAQLRVTPRTLSFTAVHGAASPAAQTVLVTAASATSAWTVDDDGLQITTTPAAGTGDGNFQVFVNTTGLAVGEYVREIYVYDDAGSPPQLVSVTITITPVPAQIVLSPSTLAFSAVRNGANPASQTIALTNGGEAQINWTAGDDAAWLSVTPASGAGPATLTASVNITGLAAGSYNATITVTDAAASNSPQTIAVALTVDPLPSSIAVTPAALTFQVPVGQNPPSQSVSITNGGDGTLAWSSSASQPWVSISPGSGGNNVTATVSIASAALAAGTYSATITLSDPQAANAPVTIPVTLTVISTTIAPSPSSLAFTVMRTQNPAAQTIAINNSGNGSLNWTAAVTSGGGWLSINPAAGTDGTVITATVSSASLAAGSYTGAITVTDPVAINSPRLIPVTLTVNPIPRSIALSPASLTFSGTRFTVCNGVTSGATPGTQGVAIGHTGDGSLSWSASSTAGWLTVTPASGVGDGSLTASVNLAGLAIGTYSAAIAVSDPSATNSPQTVTVSLTVTAAPRTLCASPGSLNFGVLGRRVNSIPQNVTITNVGDGAALAWSATESSATGTIGLTPTAGTTAGSVAVRVETTSTRGSFNGTVTISAPGAVNSPVVVPVQWSVN